MEWVLRPGLDRGNGTIWVWTATLTPALAEVWLNLLPPRIAGTHRTSVERVIVADEVRVRVVDAEDFRA